MLAIAAAAALTLGTQLVGTGDCPGIPAEVAQRLPGLSSAVRVRVSAAGGVARVQVVDAAGRVLADGSVAGPSCAALADLVAQRVRDWAMAHGAWREGGALPPPPLVDVPEARPARPVAVAPVQPAAPGFGLPFRVGAGLGIGAQFDAVGPAPGFEAWLLGGPSGAPWWGQVGLLFTPRRFLGVERFSFAWSRDPVLSAGGVYRFANLGLEVVAGLLGGPLTVTPEVAPQDTFFSFDPGGYAGARVVLSLGPVSAFLAARLSAWFVAHRLLVGSSFAGGQGGVPVVDLWFGLGAQLGSQP